MRHHGPETTCKPGCIAAPRHREQYLTACLTAKERDEIAGIARNKDTITCTVCTTTLHHPGTETPVPSNANWRDTERALRTHQSINPRCGYLATQAAMR